MRHRKHNHLLGVKTAHRISLIANLSCSLIDNGRIKTTLAKARALRPSIEKAITLAKKAHASDDAAKKVHFRRQAIARLRSKTAVKKLFDELVEQFAGRNGGYTRIYKLAIPRLGDAADMAIIEFVEEIQKKKPKKKRAAKKTKTKPSAKEEESSTVENSPENSEQAVESAVVEEDTTPTTVEPSEEASTIDLPKSKDKDEDQVVEEKKTAEKNPE